MKTNKQPLALITGGAGFIGSHLAEALTRLGCQVRVLDNLCSGRRDNLKSVWKKIQFFEADIRDQQALSKAMEGAQVVFHLAALASVPESLNQPALYVEVNGQGSLGVYQAATQARVKRVILASTSAIYGDGPCPQTENQAPQADTPYAATKLLAENLGLYFQRIWGLEVFSLRFFNVYGPRQSLTEGEASVIGLFVQAALNGQSPIIFGDGEQTRDFIEVRDVVEAMISASRSPQPTGGVFNVGTGQATSINRLYQILKELTPSLPRPIRHRDRPGDCLHSWANVSKTTRSLQSSAHIDLREGLASLLAQAKN
ncbi:MAG: NAD-dependent epimerase/dehydratase family protein [Deltaproteobacteria bacterium]|jgi:UDP-glucose 4-epimerase|nr:NAD-dependent epimerase/dehydratase family protein [Deltaproteobacteria bacterium]